MTIELYWSTPCEIYLSNFRRLAVCYSYTKGLYYDCRRQRVANDSHNFRYNRVVFIHVSSRYIIDKSSCKRRFNERMTDVRWILYYLEAIIFVMLFSFFFHFQSAYILKGLLQLYCARFARWKISFRRIDT